jgi:hypothetical protein
MLANRYVAGSAPDGHTLLLVTGAYPAQAAMLKQLSFDPLKDISMISSLIEYPFVLIVRPDAAFSRAAKMALAGGGQSFTRDWLRPATVFRRPMELGNSPNHRQGNGQVVRELQSGSGAGSERAGHETRF